MPLLDRWGFEGGPVVSHNPTDTTLVSTADSASTCQPHTVYFHPGVSHFCVIRWTAPQAGSYTLRTTMANTLPGSDGVDIWVIKNTSETLFKHYIYRKSQDFSKADLTLARGDTIDFVVGPHGDTAYDTTSISAQVEAVPSSSRSEVHKQATKAPGAGHFDLSGTKAGDGRATSSVGKISAISPAAELEALKGEWNVVRVEQGKSGDALLAMFLRYGQYDRKDLGPPILDRVAIGPDLSFLSFQAARKNRFACSIDPTLPTKTIDLHSSRGLGNRFAVSGIYEIEGNQLKICLRRNQPALKIDQRPKSFAVEPDSGDVLLVLRRCQFSEDEQAIEGNWAVIRQVEDGKPAVGEGPRTRRCRFRDYEFDLSETFPNSDVPKTRYIGGLYTLDASKQPKTIAIYEYKSVSERGRANSTRRDILGIYKFDGDHLTIAYHQHGPRPEKFESTPGSGVTLLVLEKPKPAASPKPDEPKTGESEPLPSPAKNPPATDGTPSSLLKKGAGSEPANAPCLLLARRPAAEESGVDGSMVLQKLKDYDSIYESGFSVSGTVVEQFPFNADTGARRREERRWKFTHDGNRWGWKCEVIHFEIPENKKVGSEMVVRTRAWGYGGNDASGSYYQDTNFR